MVRTLLIGEAPGRDTVGKPAFSGISGPRLADLLGVEHSELWDKFDALNLIDRYVTKFPAIEARERACAISLPETTVMVGKNVSRAFGLSQLDFFEWVRRRGSNICVVYHCSGRSRVWNEPKNTERARQFMRAIPR
jgi:hypothetical protein